MRKVFGILIIVMAALLAVSCDEYSIRKDFGSLKATIEVEQDRTIQPSQEDMTCASFTLTMHCTTSEIDDIDIDFTGNTVEVDEIPAGTWRATVEGFNSKNQPLAIAPLQTVVVTAGENVAASFVLAYRVSGSGAFYAEVSYPAALENVAKIGFEVVDVATSQTDTFSILTQTGGVPKDGYFTARSEKMFLAGQYIVSVQLLDSSNAPIGKKIVEGMNIHPYLTSSFTFAWSKEDLPSTASPVFGCASGSIVKKDTLLTIGASRWVSIAYTTDGSTPTTESDIYMGPFAITQSCTVKAIAFAPGLNPSEVVTAQYILDSQSGNFTITLPAYVTAVLKDSNGEKEGISIGVSEAHSFTMSLSDNYDGTATYSWYLDGELVPGADESTFTTGDTVLETGKHTLTAMVLTEAGIFSDSIDFEALWKFDIGSKGPNGGIVVYDCHFGARDPNALGWQYMEAVLFETEEEDEFIFGYYNPSSIPGSFRFINGETEYNSENCTSVDFGKGEFNTHLLAVFMENAAYDGMMQATKNFAALNAQEYGVNWFLPSKEEMEAIDYAGGFDYLEKGVYWTSSEDPADPCFAYVFDSSDGTFTSMDRSAPEMVLAVKTFN